VNSNNNLEQLAEVGEFVLPDLPKLFEIPDELDSLDSTGYFVTYTEDI